MVTVYELQLMMGTFFYSIFVFGLGAIVTNPFIRAKVLNMFGKRVIVATMGGRGPALHEYVVDEPVASSGDFQLVVNGQPARYKLNKAFLKTKMGVPTGLWDSDHALQIPWTALHENETGQLFDPTTYDSIVTDVMDLAETSAQQNLKKPAFFEKNGPLLCLIGIVMVIILLYSYGPKLDAIMNNQNVIYDVAQNLTKQTIAAPTIGAT